MVRLKNFHPGVNQLAFTRDAYLELSGASIVGAIDLGLFIVCCIGNSIAYQVITHLDDAHLVSE
jgi:hypothetical protein